MQWKGECTFIVVLLVDSQHSVHTLSPGNTVGPSDKHLQFHCGAVFCWESLNPDMHVLVDLLKHTFRPDHPVDTVHTTRTTQGKAGGMRQMPQATEKSQFQICYMVTEELRAMESFWHVGIY